METTSDMTEFNPAYTGARGDILGLIPDNTTRVLDIGCSTGMLGEQIKLRNDSVEVVGVELNEQMAEVARQRLDRVITGGLDQIRFEDHLIPNYFDLLIFADILEHLRKPCRLLKDTTRFLTDDGSLIASIPNVRHYSTIINLLFRGYWPYRDRGIHDKTHLRFFTLKNIKEMFQKAELQIIRIQRNYRIIERPHPYNRFSTLFVAFLFPFKDFLTFQYLIIASKLRKNKT